MSEQFRVIHIFKRMHRGGAETAIMNIYRKIDREKVQFDFLVFDTQKGDYDDEIKELGGRIFYLELGSEIGYIKYCRQLKKLFKENKNIKAVHCHTMFNSGFVMMMAFFAGKSKRITHSHNTRSVAYKENSIRQLYNFFMKKMLTIFSTDYLACSVDAGKYLFGKKIYDNGKVKVVNNSIDLNDFFDCDIDKDEYKKLNGISQDKIILGHIGRFDLQKNHKFLIDLFANTEISKKCQLLLIGDGKLQDEMREEVKKHCLEESILFLNKRSDVPQLMKAMDVFIFPSLYEGLGIVVVEAQASNLKSIISDTIPREVDLKMGLVEFKSIKDSQRSWFDEIIEMHNIEKQELDKAKLAPYNSTEVSEIMTNIYLGEA